MMSARKLWKLGVISFSFLSSSLSYSVPNDFIDVSVWGMYQGNAAHTGFVPIKINIKKIRQLWQVDVGDKNSQGINYGIYPATIGQKYVFVARKAYLNTLQAFSIKDGHVVWSKNFKDLAVQPTAFSDGKVLVQTVNNSLGGTLLRSYKEDTGETVFESPFTAQWHNYNAPVIDNNIVYACAGYTSGLNAYDSSSGEKLWSVSFGDLSEGATSAVNKKYALYYNAGLLRKLDKKTGEIISTIKDEHWEWRGYTDVTPVLFGENFAFLTFNNYLTKYNLMEDKIEFVLPNVLGNPSVDNQNIYVIKDNHLTALDAMTGNVLWRSNEDEDMVDNIEDILVTDNLVFISTDTETKAYSKASKHKVVWTANVGGKMSLSSKGLFIASPLGKLTAFKIK